MDVRGAEVREGSTVTRESRQRVDEVLDLVRERGGRATSSRRAILTCLFDDPGHHTAEDVATAVNRVLPDVHLSTIYRNLEELERLGVVVQVHLGHGPATYHLATAAHGHLVCDACGFTVEAPESLFRGLAKNALREYGFAVDPRQLAVFGRCAHCADAATATP